MQLTVIHKKANKEGPNLNSQEESIGGSVIVKDRRIIKPSSGL